ncbi:hypothetical protein BS47DRAFT_1367230 [Hydnum rufescens UP504]|uniref:DUF6534 domain-containing protein n=1 Tax=Hydnum rufescens UP504 TaxID=1448309 RepID=A0A9P6AIY7_9AGAM|nr:hypothetical protein BS47DRAFT_1367230 [Hydnum rufescens UP504]
MTVDLHIVRGLFSGSLLSTLSISSNLKDGQDSADPTSSYYRAFPNDGRAVKLVSLYRWVITNYYNPAALKHATWEFTIFQISAAIPCINPRSIAFIIPLDLHSVLVEVLVLVQFASLHDVLPVLFPRTAGFGVATGVIVNKVLNIGVVLSGYGWVTVSWLVIQATADIVIATCMCLVLQRQRTGFQKTNSMIDRMILYTISTGLITSVLSCIILGMFLKYGLNPLSGLYSVTMLAKIRRKAGNCGNEESLYQRTRINSATEVGSYDVDMNTDVSSEQ